MLLRQSSLGMLASRQAGRVLLLVAFASLLPCLVMPSAVASVTTPRPAAVGAADTVVITRDPSGSPNPVDSGGTVFCRVSAQDTMGHSLSYAWTSTAGSFEDSSQSGTIWYAPENTTGVTQFYTLGVLVTCSEGAMAFESYEQGVGSFTVSGPSGDPNPVEPYGVVHCTVSAQDSLHHTFSYFWSSPVGYFDSARVQNAVWHAPANPTGSVQYYTLTATVSCSGGKSVLVSYQQGVAPPSDVVTITSGPSGVANPTESGGKVQCSAAASDSLGHPVSYYWTAPAGSFENPDLQNAVWHAPPNTTGSAQYYTLTVKAYCTHGHSALGSYPQGVKSVPDTVAIYAGPAGNPNPVPSGGTVSCTVAAQDSLGHPLSYQWTSPGGPFENPYARQPIWHAPQNTTGSTQYYPVSVTVTCSQGKSDSGSYQQGVEPVPDSVTITAGPAGTPNPVDSAGTVSCSVAAEDALGHALTYHWGCSAGSFDHPDVQNPVWHAPPNASASTQQCVLTVTVTCSQGRSASGSYQQAVRSAADGVILTSGPSGTPNPVDSAGAVSCTVAAQDALGHALAYHWSSPAGAFDHPDVQTPTWRAPANTGDVAQQYALTVTVTCSEGASASGSFDEIVSPYQITTSTQLPVGVVQFSIPVRNPNRSDGRWTLREIISDPAAVVPHPETGEVAWWPYDTQAYTYGTVDDLLNPGYGYFVGTSAICSLEATGLPLRLDLWLNAGAWYTVGGPSQGCLWGECQRPPVDSGPWSWNTAKAAYDLSDRLDPWSGYWVHTTGSGYLRSPQGQTVVGLPRGRRATPGGPQAQAGALPPDGGPVLMGFDDVPEGYWAEAEIGEMRWLGVVSGYSLDPPIFRPREAVTRGQMAVFLCRAYLMTPLDSATPSFADVAADSWAYRHIEALYAAGIVGGYPDAAGGLPTYRPQVAVTRDQMAVFLARAAKLPLPDPEAAPFADVPVDYWAAAAIAAIKQAGITQGYPGDPPTFRPREVVTRDQMCVFLHRALVLHSEVAEAP